MSVSPLCCVSSSSLMFPLSPLTSVMTERIRLCPLDHCGTPVAASLCPGSADSFVNGFSWVGLFQVNYKPCDQLQRHKEDLHECRAQFAAGTDCARLCCQLPQTYSIDVVADHTYTPSRKFFISGVCLEADLDHASFSSALIVGQTLNLTLRSRNEEIGF